MLTTYVLYRLIRAICLTTVLPALTVSASTAVSDVIAERRRIGTRVVVRTA